MHKDTDIVVNIVMLVVYMWILIRHCDKAGKVHALLFNLEMYQW